MKNHVINPARPRAKGPVSGVIGKSRYNNYYLWPGADGPSSSESDAPYNQGTSGLGQNSSGSGLFDWGKFLESLLNAGSTVATSIWGTNNTQQAQYVNELYKQEQRTNTILWVVLGLVLALGVVLVIRKTK